MAPKHMYNGKIVVEISSKIACCIFNEGFSSVLKIMEVLDCEPGWLAVAYASTRDADRLQQAKRDATDAQKNRKIDTKQQNLEKEIL